MYDRLLDLWTAGKVDATQLQRAVDKGWITAAQRDDIMATPQVGS